MIYRIDFESDEVYQPLDWKLYSTEQQHIPLDSEEELREYLKSQPDKEFFLVPGPFFNRELQRAKAATFDPRGEHIRCGIVRYDSETRRVVTGNSIQVKYTERSRQWGEGFTLLQQATKRLEEVLGPSAPWIRAEWDRVENGKRRSVYSLRISDWTGEVSATYTPDELRSYLKDSYGWRRLWGDLLQVRSHKQLKELAEAAGTPEK